MTTNDTVWLIVGCGYVGNAVGALALSTGAAQTVIGVRRQTVAPRAGWHMLAADVTESGWEAALPKSPIACVVYCAAPGRRDAHAYRRTYVDGLGAVVSALEQHQPKPPRLVFTSSTGVYSEDAGGWVDEQTPLQASSERIQTLLDAEQLVRASGWPGSCVLRFGGIWGPGRERVQRMATQRPLPLRAAPHYSNHIHQSDCAGSIVHVATLPRPADCYVACDHEPEDFNALLVRLARAQGNPDAAQSVVPSGAATGKRCNSQKLRASGYTFAFPRYGEV